jgi:hypothetical protein
MEPVRVDVIAPLLDGWGMCASCEMLIERARLDEGPSARGMEDYPPEWQADFQRLSTLVIELAGRFGNSVLFRIFDPRSLQGLVKSIRYRVHRYPAFIINGRDKVCGYDAIKLEQALRAAGATEQLNG